MIVHIGRVEKELKIKLLLIVQKKKLGLLVLGNKWVDWMSYINM